MIKNNQEKFNQVKKLNLPLGQYALTGSSPLGIRNLREIADIDIIVSSKLWESLSQKFGITDQEGVKKIIIPENIEIFYEESFYTKPKTKDNPTVKERISDAEIIEGLPFEALKYVLYYKHKMGRDKDLKDVKLIEEWQKSKN